MDLFQDALAALDMQPGETERRAAILLSMGQAEMRAGRLDAGRADAARRGRPGPRHRRLRAARPRRPGVGSVGVRHGAERREGPDPALDEALERLPEADGALRARLLARLAAAQYWSAPAERREQLVGEAIDMARRVGDPGDAGLRALGRAPGHLGPGLAGALAALGRGALRPGRAAGEHGAGHDRPLLADLAAARAGRAGRRGPGDRDGGRGRQPSSTSSERRPSRCCCAARAS